MTCGLLATSWQTLASTHLTDSNQSENAKGRYRIQQVLQYIHEFTRAVWLGRNEVLHAQQDTADAQIYSAESAELRHYHSNPLLLFQHDRHHCTLPLTKKLLQSKPSIRRRWLRRVRLSRAQYAEDGQSQQILTRYIKYTPITNPARTPVSTATLLHTTATTNARSQTTQQRMTDFFTGRPPDSKTSSTPRNPLPT